MSRVNVGSRTSSCNTRWCCYCKGSESFFMAVLEQIIGSYESRYYKAVKGTTLHQLVR